MVLKIKCPIYRFITVPELCRKFIDTPEFQRLHRLKQLGLAYTVYPSATHTRFEHSIGVMHLAKKVAHKLGMSERDQDLEALGGLLHDIGHVAFCHLMDYILEEMKMDPELAEHENRSIFIFKKINARLNLLSPNEVEKVSNIILGKIPEDSLTPFHYQIVSNKAFGVDVDRFDYLCRDFKYLDMPCFQADYIIDNLNVTNGFLSISKKALPEVEMMYEARKRLLSLVCRHKTVIKAESVMRRAIEKLGFTQEYFKKNWETLDDYKLHVLMEENCPELLNLLYTRNFTDVKIEPDEKFKHLKYISKEDIQEQIEKVNWS